SGGLHPFRARRSSDLKSFFADQARTGQPPFDGFLHFASHIQVGESMRDPFKYIRDNVGAMTNLLEACTSTGVNRFILSSTANLRSEEHTSELQSRENI